MAKTKEQHRPALVALLESLDGEQMANFSDLVVWLRSVQLALDHESIKTRRICKGFWTNAGTKS
jgi:hypothetical protein